MKDMYGAKLICPYRMLGLTKIQLNVKLPAEGEEGDFFEKPLNYLYSFKQSFMSCVSLAFSYVIFSKTFFERSERRW